jgi:hypothetical protein
MSAITGDRAVILAEPFVVSNRWCRSTCFLTLAEAKFGQSECGFQLGRKGSRGKPMLAAVGLTRRRSARTRVRTPWGLRATASLDCDYRLRR